MVKYSAGRRLVGERSWIDEPRTAVAQPPAHGEQVDLASIVLSASGEVKSVWVQHRGNARAVVAAVFLPTAEAVLLGRA